MNFHSKLSLVDYVTFTNFLNNFRLTVYVNCIKHTIGIIQVDYKHIIILEIYFHCFFRGYLILVTMFFVTNVLNNYAFDLNIAMPLHMIFRAVCLYYLINSFRSY